MTRVSFETFPIGLSFFIFSLIVDPSTPLRGCKPQKGKQDFFLKNTEKRTLLLGSWRSDKDAKFVNIFVASFGLKPSLGKLSGHLGYLHSSLSLTSVFFLLCEQVATSIHEVSFFIRTEGALRLPTTYDNHPIQPTHPIQQSDLSRPPMTTNALCCFPWK